MNRLLIVVGCVVLNACSGDIATTPTQTDPSRIYYRIESTHRAVTLGLMDPYDTLQLGVVPYAADGSVLATDAKPVFVMTDSSNIRITPDGLLHAEGQAGAADVLVSLTVDGVTYKDTVNVAIFPSTSLPKIQSAMLVRPADSAKRAWGFSEVIATQVRDSSGAIVSGIPMRIWMNDTTRALYTRRTNRLAFNQDLIGNTTVYASATIFGRVFRDSVVWRVGHITRPTMLIGADGSFDGNMKPGTRYVGVGAVVGWQNLGDALADIIFDDPSQALRAPDSPDSVGGNIAPWSGSRQGEPRRRLFARPGTITYHSTKIPALKGTIIVVDERPCMPDCPPFP